jgi:hypothetical protein
MKEKKFRLCREGICLYNGHSIKLERQRGIVGRSRGDLYRCRVTKVPSAGELELYFKGACMRSQLVTTVTSSASETEFAPTREEKSRAKRVSRSRRSLIVAWILADAGRDAPDYVESWKAGRGAE